MRQYSRKEYSHRDIISKTFVLGIKRYVRNESLFLFFGKFERSRFATCVQIVSWEPDNYQEQLRLVQKRCENTEVFWSDKLQSGGSARKKYKKQMEEKV